MTIIIYLPHRMTVFKQFHLAFSETVGSAVCLSHYEIFPFDPPTEGKLQPLKWLYAMPGIIGNLMILRRTSYRICLCAALLCSEVVFNYRQVNQS